MSTIFFLAEYNGSTLWLPARQPTAEERASGQRQIVLPHVTEADLAQSVYLLRVPPHQLQGSQVEEAVNGFKQAMYSDPEFLQRRKFGSSDPWGARPPQQQAPPQPAPMPPSAPGVSPPPPPGAYNQMPQGYGAPAPPIPGQQGHMHGAPAPPANPYGMKVYPLPPQQAPPPERRFEPKPFTPHAPYGRVDPREVINTCDPVDDEVTVKPDADTVESFLTGSKSKQYVATLPRTRRVAWLRDYAVTVSQNMRYVCLRDGLTVVMNCDARDLTHSKPMRLVDRQLCVYFMQHGFCGRKSCQNSHFSEKQVKYLLAARHTELKNMSKEQRQKLSDDLVDEEVDPVEAEAAREGLLAGPTRSHLRPIERPRTVLTQRLALDAAASAASSSSEESDSSDSDSSSSSSSSSSSASSSSSSSDSSARNKLTEEELKKRKADKDKRRRRKEKEAKERRRRKEKERAERKSRSKKDKKESRRRRLQERVGAEEKESRRRDRSRDRDDSRHSRRHRDER